MRVQKPNREKSRSVRRKTRTEYKTRKENRVQFCTLFLFDLYSVFLYSLCVIKSFPAASKVAAALETT